MKQKIVIKMSMKDQKSRSKAMQVTFSFAGVEKTAFEGSEKDRIEVTGDGVDPVVLTTLLRKRFGSAELLSINPMDEKKVEPPKAQSGHPHNEIQYWHHGHGGGGVAAPPHFYYLENPYPYNANYSYSIW